MKTRTIILPHGNAAAAVYFSAACRKTKALRNTANFYIRNTMTGIRKSPEERTHNETEVLHHVFTGIQKANLSKDRRFARAVSKALALAGLARHAAMQKAISNAQHFAYPSLHRWFLSYEVLDAIFKETRHPAYYALQAQVNQQAIRKTVSSWKSYFHSLAEYRRDRGKFRAAPRMPGYIKNPEATAHFTSQVAKYAGGKLSFPCGGSLVDTGILPGRYVKAEVQPYHGAYRLLVTYEDGTKIPKAPKTAGRALGIDMGVDNFLAVANNFGACPFLVKGGMLKSLNRQFNKRKARLTAEITRGSDSTRSKKHSHALDALSMGRDERIRDFFYKAAHYVCRYAKGNRVSVIVIGHNEGIKDSINIGKVNNQAFVSIPFARFVKILTNVAAGYGIPVTVREESYTSKVSFPGMDEIPSYKAGDATAHVFSGRREKRGLYRTKNGIAINADVNGAANILRKEYPDAFAGQEDLSYMWETTAVVNYRDLYRVAGAKPPEKRTLRRDTRMHKPGPSSRCHHRERAKKQSGLMEAFGATKKKGRPSKEAA